MQADIDELIHVKLEGELALLLVKIDPSYKQYLTHERGHPVIHAELTKALYGMVQAALLFWKDLSAFLTSLGFKANPYDPCVMNKMIEGKQCTIAWHVDDLKLSHVKANVVEDIVQKLQDKYGNETPITVHRGTVHEYLGMTLDFSKPGDVVLTMHEYVNSIIAEAPEDLLKGAPATPAAAHLFEVNDDCEKLSTEQAELYHHLVAKLLYLSKRARPDIQLAVSFLATRVQQPDTDDYKKLGRCISYLRSTPKLELTLSADNMSVIYWWVDASFAVHPNCRSHTGYTMSFGKGSPINGSTKQKINTRSSTEAELVGVNDAMSMILWVRMFLEAQGLEIIDNVIFQDNMSSMLLERNGKQSSGKKTRHIEIRYFFIKDNIDRKRVSVEYCPTNLMWADFFTKPLQGSQFRLLRALIMNLKLTPELQALMKQADPKTIAERCPASNEPIQHDIKAEDTPASVALQECVEAVAMKDQGSPMTGRSYADVARSKGLSQRTQASRTTQLGALTSLKRL